ncbi:MAG: hypothetical protein C0504_02005 [Candidatus Solibacter sp.]|nr:hypothetical protein [Candidatus Solibacter sp.]
MRAGSALLLTAAALVCGLPARAAGDWKRASFPDWSDDLVIKLVTDSPWSRPLNVRLAWRKDAPRPFTPNDVPGVNRSPTAQPGMIQGGSPLGGIGAKKPKMPGDAGIIVRWASALPIRQAKALYRQREEKLPLPKATELIAPRGGGYVLELHGVPAEVAHQGPETVADIARQSVIMRTKTGRILRPIRAEARVNALSLTILVTFSDTEPVTLSDREVEVTGDLQIFKFRASFPVAPMVYLGNLEM